MTILNLPKHRNPEEDRRSTASYNFVPLPDKIVTAVKSPNELPDHDTYHNTGHPHTGYFDVMLTTKSPLYVRGMLTRGEFELDEKSKIATEVSSKTASHKLKTGSKTNRISFTLVMWRIQSFPGAVCAGCCGD